MYKFTFEEFKEAMRISDVDELRVNLDYMHNEAVTLVARKIECRIKYQYINAEAKPDKAFIPKGFFFIAPKKLKGSEVSFLKKYIYNQWLMELHVFRGGRICYIKKSESGWLSLLCDDED